MTRSVINIKSLYTDSMWPSGPSKILYIMPNVVNILFIFIIRNMLHETKICSETWKLMMSYQQFLGLVVPNNLIDIPRLSRTLWRRAC